MAISIQYIAQDRSLLQFEQMTVQYLSIEGNIVLLCITSDFCDKMKNLYRWYRIIKISQFMDFFFCQYCKL